MTTSNEILQLSLFETTEKSQTNTMALYDLAPRFALRSDRIGGARLTSIRRTFPFDGHLYKVVVTPARITDSEGNDRDVLPGEREQLVEDVVRKFATDKLLLADQEQVRSTFHIYRIQKELSAHKHTFSKAEIREALEILHKSSIEITRLAEPGSKKPQPVLSAAAFPVLAFADQNNVDSQAYVQLNPLLAQAIKTLAYEQVNYNWLMQVKGQLPRWVFKSLSLLFTGNGGNDMVEVRASDIANSFGSSRKRWREALSEVGKAIRKLQEVEVIDHFVTEDIKDGRTKTDVVFSIRLSAKFMADRRAARRRAEFNQEQAMKLSGTRKPQKFHQISTEEATQLKLQGTLLATEAVSLH